jgi:ATP-dependent Clp protease ATP-binding subunit ClpA
MSEDFDREARRVILDAQWHARRLGHHYVGCEHFLLAATSSDEPAGVILRAHGLAPDRVEDLIVQRAGLGAGPGLFADLDSDALAAIGIDLQAVRARAEAHFTRDDLARADRAVHCQQRPPGRGRRILLRIRVRVTLVRFWRRRRARQPADTIPEPLSLPAEPSGRYRATGPPPPPYIPFTPGAKKTLERTLHEALALGDSSAGVQHIVLALTMASTGPVPPILSAAGTTAAALRTAILDRYRQAS